LTHHIADRQGGRSRATSARAGTSHTGAGILASVSCTSNREHFIDSYLSSDTPPSSKKSLESSSNVFISRCNARSHLSHSNLCKTVNLVIYW